MLLFILVLAIPICASAVDSVVNIYQSPALKQQKTRFDRTEAAAKARMDSSITLVKFAYDRETKTAREELVKTLKAATDDATKSGNLDLAIALRAEYRKIEAGGTTKAEPKDDSKKINTSITYEDVDKLAVTIHPDGTGKVGKPGTTTYRGNWAMKEVMLFETMIRSQPVVYIVVPTTKGLRLGKTTPLPVKVSSAK